MVYNYYKALLLLLLLVKARVRSVILLSIIINIFLFQVK